MLSDFSLDRYVAAPFCIKLLNLLCNQFNEFISEFSKIYVASLTNYCFCLKTNKKKGIKSLGLVCLFQIKGYAFGFFSG